jgi:hypothetical protein
MKKMTMKQRILAVINKKEVDKIPFIQYNNLSAKNEDVWKLIGKDDFGILKWCTIYKEIHSECRIDKKELFEKDLKGEKTTINTPAGTIVEKRFFDPVLNTPHIEEHFVKEKADYDVLHYFLKHTQIVEDFDNYLADEKELGDNGLPLPKLKRTPFQQLWIEWVSLDDLIYHMVDFPDTVGKCIEELGRQLNDIFEIVRKSPVPYVDFPDNISAPIIGVDYFKQYCVPYYNRFAEMTEDKVPIFVHMDGDLKVLWDQIGESKIRGIDSFSPPPDNDTSAGQAISMWKNISLFLNFPSSIHLKEDREIYNKAMEILSEAGNSKRLQIQISENVPPDVWKKSFPQIVRAINDFGTPDN